MIRIVGIIAAAGSVQADVHDGRLFFIVVSRDDVHFGSSKVVDGIICRWSWCIVYGWWSGFGSWCISEGCVQFYRGGIFWFIGFWFVYFYLGY